jgi:hypothetical protein
LDCTRFWANLFYTNVLHFEVIMCYSFISLVHSAVAIWTMNTLIFFFLKQWNSWVNSSTFIQIWFDIKLIYFGFFWLTLKILNYIKSNFKKLKLINIKKTNTIILFFDKTNIIFPNLTKESLNLKQWQVKNECMKLI